MNPSNNQSGLPRSAPVRITRKRQANAATEANEAKEGTRKTRRRLNIAGPANNTTLESATEPNAEMMEVDGQPMAPLLRRSVRINTRTKNRIANLERRSQTPALRAESLKTRTDPIALAAIQILKNPANQTIENPLNYIENQNITKIDKFTTYLPPENIFPIDEYARKDDFVELGQFYLKSGLYHQSKIQYQLTNREYNDNYLRKNSHWIYMLTVNDQIVKIGGTKNELAERLQGYQCSISSCVSGTNRIIHNTFYFYLLLGCTIKFYGKQIDTPKYLIDIIGYQVLFKPQTYHIYEAIYIGDFENQFGNRPILSQLADSKFIPKLQDLIAPPGIRKNTLMSPIPTTSIPANTSRMSAADAAQMLPHDIAAPIRPEPKGELNRTENPPRIRLFMENNPSNL